MNYLSSSASSDGDTPLPSAPLPSTSHTRPNYQKLYAFDETQSEWHEVVLNNPSALPVSSLAILTWNIDFATPNPIDRLHTILAHIDNLGPHDAPAIVILLQEFHNSCFPALLGHELVRSKYAVTDLNRNMWPGMKYGTVTLIPISLSNSVRAIFRVPFPNSTMGRDALFADLQLHSSSHILRIANTHLESLPGHGDRARPVQLAEIAQFLKCIEVGIVGGDMNAISPSDVQLPREVGLADAWLDSGHAPDDAAEGHTWGYWPVTSFPPNRLDKLLYTAQSPEGIHITAVRRVGVGLELGVEDRVYNWASDHCGIMMDIRFSPE